MFKAFNVGAGDAFYIERGDKNAIIDGGKNNQNLLCYLNSLHVKKINYMICTHNDSDHVNGLFNVLKSNIQIDELWVPASFLSFINKVNDMSAEEIIREISSFRSVAKQTRFNELIDDLNELGEDKDFLKNREELSNDIESVDVREIEDNIFSIAFFNKLKRIFIIQNYIMSFSLPKFDEVINLFELIILARKKKQNINVKIRYFEYQKTSSQVKHDGDRNFLICLNSNEVNRIKKNINSLEYLLHLTRVNRHALVFYHPNSNCEECAVLFSSDSNLTSLKAPANIPKNLIVTTPHHGAKENERAFNKINNVFGISTKIWVRSDNSNSSRPACWFKKIAGPKYCTNCNGNGTMSKQDINISSTGVVFHATKSCSCKCSLNSKYKC